MGVNYESTDFTPKEVIDVEQSLLDRDRSERQQSKLAKVTCTFFNECLCLALSLIMAVITIALAIHYLLVK